MKHCILVKWKEPEKMAACETDIRQIFQETLEIEGIEDVSFRKNCIARKNRYDYLIEITMEEQALEAYDHSDAHVQWKERYSPFIESKAIFDFREDE